MKITIESTETITNYRGVEARLWVGVTDGGVRCELLVPLISAMSDQDSAEFDRELRSLPSVGVPLRRVLGDAVP